jgi:iron-sulfur cluster repair protein YtfE (RIC family)
MDVLQLLKKDHAEVMKLFQRFHGNGGRGRKAVVNKICQELEVHTEVEEELFYPAVREEGDAELRRMVDEAIQEHGRAKQQIQAIRGMSGDDSDDDEGRLEGMIATLEQDIEHHVTEEEGEMFPRVQEAMEDRRRSDLGRRVRERKGELMGGGRSSSSSRRRATGGRTTSARRTGRTQEAKRGKGKQAQRGRAKTTTSRAKSGTKSRTKRARGGRSR